MTDLTHPDQPQAAGGRADWVPGGLRDIAQAFRRYHLWIDVAWATFQSRHQRTVLGPLWEPIKSLIWVLALSQIFRAVLATTNENYMAYVAAGIVLWNYIVTMFSGSTNIFTGNRPLILNVKTPLYSHVLSHISRGFIRFVHELPVYLVTLPFCAVQFGWVTLLAIPGFFLVQLTGMWVSPLMGMLGARYADFPFAVGSVMRFLFYATPVFWMAEGLGQRAYLAHFNPLTHYLSIVRDPLLGMAPAPESWLIVGGIFLAGLFVSAAIYQRYYRRIPLWL